MADEFVYIVQGRDGRYITRCKVGVDDYLEDIEHGKKLGYSHVRTFRVPSELFDSVLEKCLEFEKDSRSGKSVSLSKLEEKIDSIIKPSK